jgi:hypothetical protein
VIFETEGEPHPLKLMACWLEALRLIRNDVILDQLRSAFWRPEAERRLHLSSVREDLGDHQYCR